MYFFKIPNKMNEIIFTLKVDGAVLTARVMGFTNRSLKFEIEGRAVYMTKSLFNVWRFHPEMDLKAGTVVAPSGMELTFLN